MSSLILIEGSFRVIWKLVALQACSAKRILREHCRPNLRTNEVVERYARSVVASYLLRVRTYVFNQSQRYYLHIWNFRPEIHFVSLFEIRVSYLYLALKRYLRILDAESQKDGRPTKPGAQVTLATRTNKDPHDGSALSSSPLLPS